MRAVFVGGSGRSGTTMTGAMLAGAPGTVCVPEMHFKLDLDRAFDGSGDVDADRAAAWLERRWDMAAWGFRAAPLEPGRRYASAAAVVEDLVRAWARKAGRPDPAVWIDHTPANLHEGRLLADRYPDSAFVHVVRDGRAVAASVLGLDWGPTDVPTAARTWGTDVAAGLALEDALPGRVARVRYEDLVAEPEPTLRALCGRIGLAFDPRMADGGAFHRPAYVEETHPRVASPPDPSRIDRWRTTLSAREIEAFEFVAQGVLANLGYPLVHGGGARRPPWTWETATWIRGRVRKVLLDPRLRRRSRRRWAAAARDGEAGDGG